MDDKMGGKESKEEKNIDKAAVDNAAVENGVEAPAENAAEIKAEEIDETAKNKRLADEYRDKLQRTAAEFDNFRKRTLKEKASMYDDGVRDTVLQILPIMDNFGRALQSSDNTEDSFYKGVNMILKQFEGILDCLGVVEILAEGVQFDPNFHNAVMHIEDENYGENTVVEVLQKGYQFKDKVIRHSLVKVAN